MDTAILFYVPFLVVVATLAVLGAGPSQSQLVLNVVQLGCLALFLFRDSVFRGAGIGKRLTGLRVVQSKDGETPLTYGQGVVRWLSQYIPFFNLYDAAVPYRDPLLRRVGDRWAGTRVIDTERKLAKVREKIARCLIKKGVQPAPEVGMTMEELARLA